ncbi:hypothetical protein PJ311_14655 [Bacillus sp. CLL-7-23]|uniref:Uncharacterized protein n=1 Tax=Bacillus changyiensis TaxID=3004103 RepID=A0ABT4X6H6_9BACI|nr:hypothetical protein [Bacillus changyiensis]MDA7027818.1 hypothetical protein [Bacillus changyiensis]
MLTRTLEERTALDMIYMRRDGHTIIVHQINEGFIQAYCFKSRKTKIQDIYN